VISLTTLGLKRFLLFTRSPSVILQVIWVSVKQIFSPVGFDGLNRWVYPFRVNFLGALCWGIQSPPPFLTRTDPSSSHGQLKYFHSLIRLYWPFRLRAFLEAQHR